MKQKLDSIQKKELGEKIRQQLFENQVENSKRGKRELISTPKELAASIGVTEATIYKAHSGDFSIKTLKLIEQTLCVSFLSTEKAANMPVASSQSHSSVMVTEQGLTKVKLGGYSKDAVYPYLGTFIAASRGVSIKENFLISVFTVEWDDELGGARFKEFKKFTASDGRIHDYSQGGTLHISAEIKVVHLLTSHHGALRLISLTGLLRDPEPVMYGAILTQVPEVGYYRPAKSTIHFRKVEEDKVDYAMSLIGPIAPEHELYQSFVRDLNDADKTIYTR